MEVLKSYLNGMWCSGDPSGVQTLYNPTTGESVAQCSTAQLDLSTALKYAREVGGPALQSLSFQERGIRLEKLSHAIHAKRDLLIEIGRVNAGNTRGDAKFDIDGATHTLMHYAELAKTLESQTLFDGSPSPVGRGGRLNGQHILSPLQGVAVHINAFNFPVWGLAEKAACAILAGMPILCKPATSTAWMTFIAAEAIVPLLPAGSFNLLCGGAGQLLSHLEWGDVVAFTGSADTGLKIRSHTNILTRGVRVNIEADSLNGALLDPDASDDSYDALIRDVHKEVTQKAGQKCTATRRVLIPQTHINDFIEDLSERFGRTIVGDPHLDDVNMGPLCTPSQQVNVLEGLDQLLTQSKVVYGGPQGETRGVEPNTGAFVHPTILLSQPEPNHDALVHQLEVFGPIVTIIPYDGHAAQGVAQLRHGAGCLVGSIYGDNSAFLKQAIQGLASWHGRLVVVDEQVANKALSPGLVTPQLLHGGPGRAGGGEELGDLRGLSLYQQRCAIQGNGPKIARLLKG